MTVTTKELWEQAGKQIQPPTSELHPADEGYSPPVSTVALPSRGLTYPPESPLYRCEALDIRAVTAKEEDILSSPSLIKKGLVLTALMRACITNRLVDPEQMLVGDRNAVLVSIRVSAYGPGYSCNVMCPECGEETQHEFNLGLLSLKSLDIEPVAGPGTSEFEWTLPISKRKVRFKLMDAAMAAKLDRDLEATRKKGQDRGVTMRLMSQVTAIEGVEAKNLPRAIGDMAAGDSRALRLYMDRMMPGVDMEQEFECPACGKVNEVDIPIGTEFFWPSEQGEP